MYSYDIHDLNPASWDSVLPFALFFLFVTTCSGTMVFIVYNLFTYLFNPRIHTCKVVSELLSCCPVMKKLYKPEYSIYVVIVFQYHCFPKLLWSALFIPTHFNKVMSYICNTVRVICHSLHSTLPGFPQHFCWLKKNVCNKVHFVWVESFIHQPRTVQSP